MAAAEPTYEAAPAAPVMTSEDEAKRAWLAKLDVPSWGQKEVAQLATVMSEEAAKAAWLSKLDVPSWGQSAASSS
eukprot:4515358-Prymnesium_polylepis.1